MIVCRALSKRYGTFEALSDLDLHIKAGDTFGFIGPNGAGKTTTIRILATLLEPSSGEAIVDGHSVLEEPHTIRRLLGYMPDSFGVYDGMKVWEYLDFFAGAFRLERSVRPKVIDDVLELTDLGRKKEDFVEALSTGMRQRLCLAKTLLHDPKVLILDEPAAGLDPRARIEMRELLRELTRMGKTIMISSHILPELADFCNRVGVLEAGHLVASGTIDEIMGSLQSERKITVRVLREGPRAAETLQSRATVSDLDLVDSQPAVLRFAHSGDLDDLASIAEELAGEYGLIGLEEQKTDLEDLFLRVTKGIVQ